MFQSHASKDHGKLAIFINVLLLKKVKFCQSVSEKSQILAKYCENKCQFCQRVTENMQFCERVAEKTHQTL